ncbi:formin-like protein 18 [Desulfoplanes sp. PS50]
MGRFLQIRVMAHTYDESDLAKAWPTLWALGFPETSPSPMMSRKKGVLELVDSLADQIRFDMIDPSVQKVLQSGADQAKRLKKELEQALADWNPQKANTLSDQLEETLTELEKEASGI